MTTTTRTRHDLYAQTDRIAAEHGCDLQPSPFGGPQHICVLGYWRRGDPHDDQRIATCRRALQAAGLGWMVR
jgi:hypothetical protein